MTTKRLADYVADFISEQIGATAVFLVPGGGNMYLADAIGNHEKITYVAHHHEQAAAIAAEAYGRVSGRVGVALVTTGPGGTNAVTGVAGAWIDSAPMLVISGQVKRADLKLKTGVRQMGPQEVDIISIVKPITKYAVTVMDPTRIRYHLEEAIWHATHGRKGPVWIDIPLDVQASPLDPEALDGFVPPITKVTDLPTQDARRVFELICKSERPLLLAGHGVRQSGAAATFIQFAERLNIPVATTWLACDLLPSTHRLSVGRPGTVALRAPNFAVQNSDLIVAIGARLDNVTTAYNPSKFGRAALKVMVDIDRAELAKLGDAVDLKIEADARAFMERMLAVSEDAQTQDRTEWIDLIARWKERYPPDSGEGLDRAGPIGHYELTSALSHEIPEESLIVTGSSGLAIEIFYASFSVKRGQRLFLTSGLGAMGYGLPALIGGGMANGGRRFVALESDGSLMMNAQELSTIAAQNIPVTIFVLNNNGYASIRNTQRNYFRGRYVGTGPEAKLNFPDIAKLAEIHGITAMTIHDRNELRTAVRSAIAFRDGPIVCDVRLLNDEALLPKSAAMPQPDGSILSMPLEDMMPLLPLDELRSNMKVPLDPASEAARR